MDHLIFNQQPYSLCQDTVRPNLHHIKVKHLRMSNSSTFCGRLEQICSGLANSDKFNNKYLPWRSLQEKYILIYILLTYVYDTVFPLVITTNKTNLDRKYYKKSRKHYFLYFLLEFNKNYEKHQIENFFESNWTLHHSLRYSINKEQIENY